MFDLGGLLSAVIGVLIVLPVAGFVLRRLGMSPERESRSTAALTVPQPRITREDVSSMVAARQELGAEMEPAVVDAFLEKVEAAIEAQAAERRPRPRGTVPRAASGWRWRSSRSAPASRSPRSPRTPPRRSASRSPGPGSP